MRLITFFLFLSVALFGQQSYTKEDLAGSWKFKKLLGKEYTSERILNFNAGESTFALHLCNSIAGNYSIAKKDVLKMTVTVSTKMFCPDDETLESTILSVIGRVNRMVINGLILQLYDGKNLLIEFDRIITRTAPTKPSIANLELDITDYQAGDIVLKKTKNTSKIIISDDNGIGKMKVTSKTKWKKGVSIELNLKALEHLSIEFNQGMHVDYSYNSGSGASSKNWSIMDETTKKQVVGKNDVKISLVKTGDAQKFIIFIPKKLLKLAGTTSEPAVLQVKWIDYFRG